MLNCDFFQVFVFTIDHHLKPQTGVVGLCDGAG